MHINLMSNVIKGQVIYLQALQKITKYTHNFCRCAKVSHLFPVCVSGSAAIWTWKIHLKQKASVSLDFTETNKGCVPLKQLKQHVINVFTENYEYVVIERNKIKAATNFWTIQIFNS